MEQINKLSKALSRQITIILIPHNTGKPFRVSFTLAFLIFLTATWTGVTIWAGTIAGKHIDYVITKCEYQLMGLKVQFFANQVKKSREMLEQVVDRDRQMREILKLKTKKEIIEYEGKGGPGPDDVLDLERVLAGKVDQMSINDIFRQITTLNNTTQQQLKSHEELFTYIDEKRSIFRATPNTRPCVGRVTSRYGYRIHPIIRIHEFHKGVDMANLKNTPIYSTAYGTVVLCEWQPGYGRLVVINHGYGYKTYYAHMHKILVKPGDYVKRGQLIGLMGDTGTSTGNHCHYEVRFNNRTLNPIRYFQKDVYISTDLSKNLN